jgi:hypothetical protein
MKLFLLDKVKENREAFGRKVIEVSQYLGINPDWLMLIMYHESGGTFSARITNSMGCVGLIQFCPNGGLTQSGLSQSQMASLSNVEQLEYVKKYFAYYRGKIDSFFDLYTIVFYPVAFKKYDRSWKYGSEQSDAYARSVKSWNSGFDLNNDGYVSIGDFENYLKNYLKQVNAPFKVFDKNNFEMAGIDFSYIFNNKYIFPIAIILAVVVVFWIFTPPQKRHIYT